MVKQVLSNAMVRHVWAAQTQASARTSNGNLWFEGSTLYSYYTPIANIVPGADGRPVALLTCNTYSTTTSGKHMPRHRDVSHMRTFPVPYLLIGSDWAGRGRYSASLAHPPRDWQNDEPGDVYNARCVAGEHAANVAHMLDSYRNEIANARRKRSLPWWCDATETHYRNGSPVPNTEMPAEPVGDMGDYGQPGRHLAQLRAYCEAFALALPEMPDVERDRADLIAHHAARIARNSTPAAIAKRAREAARRAEREAQAEVRRLEAIAKARAEGAEALALWLAGDTSVQLPWDARTTPSGGAYCRVSGDEVQTSQGARVPLSSGRALFRMAAECRAKGTEWRGAHRVGSFTLTSISATGDARVGCHLLEWDEMSRAAHAAGIEIPAASVPQGWAEIEA